LGHVGQQPCAVVGIAAHHGEVDIEKVDGCLFVALHEVAMKHKDIFDVPRELVRTPEVL
jgi:hypothetical protein